jgi:hypothetical protein
VISGCVWQWSPRWSFGVARRRGNGAGEKRGNGELGRDGGRRFFVQRHTDRYPALADDRTLVALWRSQWQEHRSAHGLEHVTVKRGYANGVILGMDESASPYRVQYEIEWDDNNCTREVEIDVAAGAAVRSYHLSVDEAAHWFDGEGTEIHQLAGCLDIDIWPTPFTNSLAIWRLQLAPGERETITVVWLDALSGALKTVRQAYTRLEQDSYRFEDLDTGFTAELVTDPDGLVLEYPGLFARV